MARYCPLFSGSSGNSTCFVAPAGGILIDAGVSAKRLCEALSARNIAPESIRAIFITHEHIDHIRGLKVFLKRFPVPVYCTAGTAQGMAMADALPPGADVRMITEETEAAGMTVTPFPTPHDSLESCGYRICFPDGRVAAVATDIGCLTQTVRQALLGCDLVHIESNHDERMLQNGSYPYALKERIRGDRGHLANRVCAQFVPQLVQSGTTRITLSHLSRENNTPQLARRASADALCAIGAKEETDYRLTVAPPDATAPVIYF